MEHPFCNDFKPLNDQKRYALIKQYTQLKLVVFDKISLIGNRMFTFIDKRLCIIKCKHNNFFGNLELLLLATIGTKYVHQLSLCPMIQAKLKVFIKSFN